MSQATPTQDAIYPRGVDAITADFSELELSDPRFRFFSDAIKAASDPGDSLSEEEKAALSATKLKLKHDASLLALGQFPTQVRVSGPLPDTFCRFT
jgi:hypothetical protein